jgi:hypothetical protein
MLRSNTSFFQPLKSLVCSTHAATADAQPQTQSCVRAANRYVVDVSTLERLANASSSSRLSRNAQSQQPGLAQQVQELLEQKKGKPAAQLANTFRDGDPGDKGLRRRFVVLNGRFLSADKRRFSFT